MVLLFPAHVMTNLVRLLTRHWVFLIEGWDANIERIVKLG